MMRDDFLTELRLALQGNVEQAVVNENISYYEQYIIEESHKGKTEEEVMAALGNPRLLAKTIIDTSSKASYQETETAQEETKQNRPHTRRIWEILLIAVVVLVIVGIVGSIISIFLPLIIPAVILLLVVGIINRNRR